MRVEGASATILVLEDDDVLRQALASALEDEGYAVWPAASGHEAIDRALEREFHLVIADVRMAGMDGIEALSNIRQLHPRVKSIVMTGYASEDAPSRAIQLMASDYLYKPFRVGELLRSVGEVLSSDESRQNSLSLLEMFSVGHQLLKKALSGPKLARLDRERERAFQSFYVAVRSRKLQEREACTVWDRLEELESKREALHVSKPTADWDPDDVLAGYRSVVDLLSAIERQSLPLLSQRRPGQIDPALFALFFQRIRDGKIPLHRVVLAPFLRSLDHLALAQSDDLEQAYRYVWDAPAPA